MKKSSPKSRGPAFANFEDAVAYAERMCGRNPDLPEMYTRFDVVAWPEDGRTRYWAFSFPTAAALVSRNGRVRNVYHTEK